MVYSTLNFLIVMCLISYVFIYLFIRILNFFVNSKHVFSFLHLGLLDGEVLCLRSTLGNVREIIAQSIYHMLTESQAEKL